jgi:hypothetical protein
VSDTVPLLARESRASRVILVVKRFALSSLLATARCQTPSRDCDTRSTGKRRRDAPAPPPTSSSSFANLGDIDREHGAPGGGCLHRSRGSDVERVRRVKEHDPELRVIPQTSAENVDAMLGAGAEGAVVQFAEEAAMREFARHYP